MTMEKKFIMITADKFKFLLTEAERNMVNKAVAKGDKFLVIQDATVPLSICPTVLPLDRWRNQENDRLMVSGKKLCRKCNAVRDVDSRECHMCAGRRNEPGLPAIKAPLIPSEVLKMLKEKVLGKTF